ncbi:unnamed protein product [Notodromas monacha]|uniref:Uncharacterized protein n=1 Tax=Notodromas monacha TaxID=399045 RepID=A0A7R9GI41_9CRUS|nr:unnamed protein product [Notodromas monacha]CAG0922187.1 unnamed protein product [Notodromas monacha]
MQNWRTSTEIAESEKDGLMDPRKFDGPSTATPSVHANKLLSKNSKEAHALAFIRIFQSHEYGPKGVADFDSDQVATLAKKYPRGVPSMTQLILLEDQKLDWPNLLTNWPVNNLDVHGLTAYDLAVRRMPLSTRLGFNRSHDDKHKMPWQTVLALEKSAAARYLVSSGPILTDQAESCFPIYSSVITMRAAHEARRSRSSPVESFSKVFTGV